MTRQSSPLRASTWLAALVAVTAGCSVDDALKHSCVATTDCLHGRVCIEGRCIALDASSAGRDSSSEKLRDGRTSEAPESSEAAAPDEAGSSGGGGVGADDGGAGAAGGGASGAGGAGARDAGDGGIDASVTVPGHNYVFVTSKVFSFLGMTIDQADKHCNDAAEAASLPGVYRAWISTSTVNARDRLPSPGGWLRTDGLPFAQSLTDLLAGHILRPPSMDERGFPVDPELGFLTGTQSSGVAAPDGTCNDWTETNGSMQEAAEGQVAATTGQWTNSELQLCGLNTPLLCFGIDGDDGVRQALAPGKRAFVTDGTFAPSGGLAAADALCGREANAVGLSGNYLALLSTMTASAASRFGDVPDQTWVRLDGVALTAPGHTLFDGHPLAAPLNVTSRGRYIDIGGENVFTGSDEPSRASSAGQDCMGWQSSDATLSAVTSYGESNIRSWWSSGILQPACGYPAHLYCLQHDEGAGGGVPDGGLGVDAGPGVPDAAPGLDATPSATPNYVFRTAGTYPTQKRTFVLADAQCNAEAAYAGLPGSYRAWFSTSTTDARDRLTGARGWIRPDGVPFADTIDDIVNGRILSPINVDAFGNDPVWTLVMTGTTSTGIAATTCHDWTDGPSDGTEGTIGETVATGTYWTSGDFGPCGHPSVLYCFGVSQSAPLAFHPQSGRLAFLSSSMFTASEGLSAADALCNADASAAGLPGSFAALLPTSTASAASRFAAFEDSVWVRPDGVALNLPGERLFDLRDTRVPLSELASGGYAVNAYAMTGVTSPRYVPTSAEVCDDWSSASPKEKVDMANVTFGVNWFSSSGGDCSYPAQLFCLEH
jgi:hypothetical protein